MELKNSDELIKALAADLGFGQTSIPNSSKSKAFSTQRSLWLYTGVICSYLFWISLLGTAGTKPSPFYDRADIIFKIIFGILAAALTARVALKSAIPGSSTLKATGMSLLYVTAWIISCEIMTTNHVQAEVDPWSHCMECVIGVSGFMILPALTLLYFVWQGAVLRSGFSVFFAVLSAGLVANMAMMLRCDVESPLHSLLFHIIPCAILLTACVIMADRFFNWKSQNQRFIAKL